MDIPPEGDHAESELCSTLETAYAELDHRLAKKGDTVPAVDINGVHIYDVRQDGSNWWESSFAGRQRPEEEEVWQCYKQIIDEYGLDLDASQYISSEEEFFYKMTDAVFADRVYSPPSYLHVALDYLNIPRNDIGTMVAALNEFEDGSVEEIYIEDDPIEEWENTGDLFDVYWSNDNIVSRELTRTFEDGRPAGEHLLRNISFEFDNSDESPSQDLANWLFLKIMANDSSDNYYPLFAIPAGRLKEKKETSIQLTGFLEKIRG